ncbi:MAG TPA: hypothetical protein PK127_01225 [Clostridiales bacterium]|nr:hypothetical protein [Clostridiales bacterium]HPV01088.1 hypothetical protein [Clostridiales bacterium]
MYIIIATASTIIRQFLLPNPFSSLPNGGLYNLAASILLNPLTFFIDGLFYDRGSDPACGSFLYLVFYIIHTGMSTPESF